jgi:hypothetical protein
LRGGTYGGIHTLFSLVNSGGSSAPITITSYPGETAKLIGWLDLEGSYTTLSRLQIDGSNNFYNQSPGGGCAAPTSQALVIAGHDDTLEYSDYYQSVPSLRGVGIGIGWWGNADNTVIRFNKIHDVGQCQAYTPIVYLAHGNNVQIYGNWMWNDSHGRGVQLYPGPTNARVFGNVVDRAGCGFVISGDASAVSSGNQIYNNIVTNSTGLPWDYQSGFAITDSWDRTRGSGNAFYANISYRNPGGIARVSAVAIYGNITADPGFVDPKRHNYNLRQPLGGRRGA